MTPENPRSGFKEGRYRSPREPFASSRSLLAPWEVIDFLERVVGENTLAGVDGREKRFFVELNSVGITLGPEQLKELLFAARRSEEFASDRVGKLNRTLPNQFNVEARWLGGQLAKLTTGEGKPLFPDRSRLYPAALEFLGVLPQLAETPVVYVPEATPPEKILSRKELEDAADFIALSEEPHSVSRQLRNSVRLSSNGLLVIPKLENQEEALNYGFTVPSILLKILETLKYPESEEIFRAWLVEKSTSSEAEAEKAVAFLEALINFASFLDSQSYHDLWEPPEAGGREQEEVLFQPFRTLLRSLQAGEEKARLARLVYEREFNQLTNPDEAKEFGRQRETFAKREAELKRIKNLLLFRYYEVYTERYRTSLYTFGMTALIPAPERFAEIALSMVDFNQGNGMSVAETAAALVKMAEMIGVQDISFLSQDLDHQPGLQQTLIEKAKRAGLLPDEEAIAKVLEKLGDWHDAANVDFNKIIGEETTDLEVYIYTGTFGPFTKGHKDLLERLLFYIDSLPQQDGSRIFQRIVLIIPITDVSGIRYEKTPAQVGTLEARVSSILLQLAGAVDPKRVLITTALQPHPALARSLEGRARDTLHSLGGKISSDLRKAGRAAEYRPPIIRFAFGPDELAWRGRLQAREISPAENQRGKVTEPGGVLVVRRGWLLDVLRNFEGIKESTGVSAVILTPGTPYSSSTSVIGEIATSGYTRAVEQAARNLVVSHWSPEAIKRRGEEMKRQEASGITLQQAPSVDKIRNKLAKELGGL